MSGICNSISNIKTNVFAYCSELSNQVAYYVNIFLDKVWRGQSSPLESSFQADQIKQMPHQVDATSLSFVEKITFFFKKIHNSYLNKMSLGIELKAVHQMMCQEEEINSKIKQLIMQKSTDGKYEVLTIPKQFVTDIKRQMEFKYKDKILVSLDPDLKSIEGEHVLNGRIFAVANSLYQDLGLDATRRILSFCHQGCMARLTENFVHSYGDASTEFGLKFEVLSDANKGEMRISGKVLLTHRDSDNPECIKRYFIIKASITIPISDLKKGEEEFKKLTLKNWTVEDQVSSLITNKNEAEHLFKQF